MPIQQITTGIIQDGAIVTTDIANGTVTGPKLGANSVSSNNIVSVLGSAITANTIANSAIQTGAVENYLNSQNLALSGMRNKIINGAMQIDQRSAGANVQFGTGSSTSDNYTAYTLDRWFAQSYQSTAGKGGTFLVQQNGGSITPPTGFQNYLRAIVTFAQTDVATDSALYRLTTKIEGYNLSGTGWGTANAQSCTLSFWVRSSLTGTYTIQLTNDVDLSYTTTYTVIAANTWEKKTIVIPGPTTATWNVTNGLGIQIDWTLAASTGRTGGTLNSWLANTKQAATGQVNFMGTLGNAYHLTGVQFEVGSQATPFEYRHYGTEYNLCLRYFWKSVGPYSAANGQIAAGMQYNGGDVRAVLHHPVPMRGVPAVTFSGSGFGFERPGLSYGTIGTPFSANMTPYATLLYSSGSTSAGMSNGYATVWGFTNDTTSISVSAEL